jgi:hypothetical protein
MMFAIGEIFVEERIADLPFACDVEKCKGACCTLKGGRGAPLDDREVEEIERWFPAVRKYLPQAHLSVIDRDGMIEGSSKYFATRCVNDADCVFVYYDGGIAQCAFERAFLNNEIGWRKPISCHLFPMRTSSGIAPHLRFEYLHHCEAGLLRGAKEHILLRDFLKDALLRAYGAEWCENFQATCEKQGLTY